MRRLLYIILAVSIAFATTLFTGLSVQSAIPAKINWSTVAPTPLTRFEANGGLLNGELYVFGGYIPSISGLAPNTRSDVYNPINNTWTQIADTPSPGFTHAGTQVVGKDIYFAGGYTGPGAGKDQTFATRAVWKYSADTNSWLAMPSLPAARAAGALAVLNGNLHFFGGADIKRIDKSEHWVLSLNDLNKGWTSAASLPTPRNHLGRAVVGGKIYAIGGQKGTNDTVNQLANVDVWNPATNKWTPVASMPIPRSHISGATFAMDNKWIIVAGGLTNTASPTQRKSLSNVTLYDPTSNSWKELTPLPTVRSSGIARSIGNQIFHATGSTDPVSDKKTYKGVLVN